MAPDYPNAKAIARSWSKVRDRFTRSIFLSNSILIAFVPTFDRVPFPEDDAHDDDRASQQNVFS